MNYKSIEYADHGNYGVLKLNIPDKLNAMSPQMLLDLRHFFEQTFPTHIRFLIISGNGKCFGAGGDLKAMYSMDRESAADISHQTHKTFAQIRNIPIPVVASIHGFALGGGFELALACDLIFAMPDVWFSLPELKYNMLPGGGGTVRLPQAIGYKQAFWTILTSSKITAQEALQKGIIQHIFETDNPLEETISLLNLITKEIEYEAIALLKEVLQSTQPYNSVAYKLEAENFSYLLDKYAKKSIHKFMNK